jgi:hypothetical protein
MPRLFAVLTTATDWGYIPAEVMRVAIGNPQDGHFSACVDTRVLHSGQLINAIRLLLESSQSARF